MDIDESRRDHPPVGVDLSTASVGDFADLDNAAAVDSNVRDNARGPAAVDNLSASDNDVVHRSPPLSSISRLAPTGAQDLTRSSPGQTSGLLDDCASNDRLAEPTRRPAQPRRSQRQVVDEDIRLPVEFVEREDRHVPMVALREDPSP